MNSKSDLFGERLSLLFDKRWYLERYSEVAATGVDPLSHYLEYGAAAGYDPHPMFATSWYLERYPDVAAAGLNPLVHYIEHGGFEHRDPHPLFDTIWYLRRNSDASSAGVNPLVDYIERGAADRRQPGPLFSDSINWETDRDLVVKVRTHYDASVGWVGTTKRTRWGKVGERLRRIFIDLGKSLYARSLYLGAFAFFKAAHFLGPATRDELLTWLAKCDIRRGRFADAFDCYLRLFYIAPSPKLDVCKESVPDIYRATKPLKSIGVVTSFMPNRIEAQQAALRSWCAAGLSVTSVNSALEIERLRDHFPDVIFCVVEQPVEIFGRPLIPISALISAAEKLPHDVCGIINSDVVFRGDSLFFDAVRREVPTSLVFGCRIDVIQAGTKGGKAFRNGYDFFFWERQNSALFKETPMVLGLPWWDFWLPLQANAKGLRMKRFVTSSMVHVIHTIGYDIFSYVSYGRLCAEALADVYSQWKSERMADSRAFLYRLFATTATISVDLDSDAALRKIGAFCELSNCMIDALSEKVVLQDARSASGTLDSI